MDKVPFPSAAFGIFGIFFTIYILIIVAATLTMIVAFWRMMRAHEAIAERMGGIERSLATRAGDVRPPL
jgi:uncharacterized membrane protein